MSRVQKPNKFSSITADGVEKRILDLSRKNPEFGARRLAALLKPEDINVSESTIYSVLKRHGLNTRFLRLSKIEALPLSTAFPEAAETPAPYAELQGVPHEESESVVEEAKSRILPPEALKTPTVFEDTEEGVISRQASPISIKHAKPKARNPWFLTLLNILLFLSLVFLGFDTVQNVRTSSREPAAGAAVYRAPVAPKIERETDLQPFSHYRIISERNLFNISKENAPDSKKDIVTENIAPATADLGLKLLGTVVADDITVSLAIVHDEKTREQAVYHQGDYAGNVRIKKILRSKVVITTDKGDELLTIDVGKSGQARTGLIRQRSTPVDSDSFIQTFGSQPPVLRRRIRNINREDMEKFLADVDGLMAQLNISTKTADGQALGFKISNIPRRSLLWKMGLRNRDVITGVNDQAITGEEQAAEFFNKLSEGGGFSINIMRRNRNRQINLNIE
jgi:type II secretion system protein C